MSKIAIVGDVHGRSNWEQIPHLTSYDRIIFMGDYFDPYAYDVGSDTVYRNFVDILDFKRANPEKVVLLFGNHDLHYLVAPYGSRERYSRFDTNLIQQYHVYSDLEKALKEGLVTVAYTIPHTDLFFTHATLSIRWYNLHILKNTFSGYQEEGITTVADSNMLVSQLQQLLLSHPEAFYFNGPYWDMYGYANTQGPLWWRCMNEDGQGLQEREILKGIYQVNGHTQVPKLSLNVCESGAKVAFVDLLGSNKYTEVTVTGDYRYCFTEKQISKEFSIDE